MRIAYLVSLYPAVSHAFLEREVRSLRRLGVEVDTVSIRSARPPDLLTERDREEAARTVDILPAGPATLLAAQVSAFARGPMRYLATLARSIRLSQPGLRGRLFGLFYFAEAMVVRRHCRRAGITHIHATQFADAAATVGLLAAHLVRSGARDWTWSLAVHGPTEFYDASRYRLAEKVRCAAFTVAVSEFTRSQLMALVEERRWSRINVVHMGVDTDSYRLRDRPPRSGAEVRVLSVARLVPHKGQALLLRALAGLRDEGLPLATRIVGDGEERGALAELVSQLGLSGQVELCGPVGQDRLPDFYAAADVFCLPTLAEAVGVANMEAMATGLPVVSSRLMGIPELVEDGASGLLVTPGSVSELATALRALAADPELRRRMGEAGRRKVEAEFDSAVEAAKLRDLLADYA